MDPLGYCFRLNGVLSASSVSRWPAGQPGVLPGAAAAPAARWRASVLDRPSQTAPGGPIRCGLIEDAAAVTVAGSPRDSQPAEPRRIYVESGVRDGRNGHSGRP